LDLGSRALAAAGADLMINGFGEGAAIEKLRREIAVTHGVRVAFSAADLSKPADTTGLIEHATRELGRVDVLVNNAGIQHVAPVHEFPLDRWEAVIAT
jgi:3-hydroxybutyrate dehydrogenase